MNKRAAIILFLAVVLLAWAGFRFFRFVGEGRQGDEMAYFYDLSERKLFVAPRTLVPPIRGINNDERDGMRAIVVSTDPGNKSSRRIAYLEKYAPELKQQIETVQSGRPLPASEGRRISRGVAQALIFVRRPNEETWYAVNSVEGERVMTEWQAPGPDGRMPVICAP